jgi:hypothetical protein
MRDFGFSAGRVISTLFQQVDDLKDEVEDLKEEVDSQATIIEDYEVNAGGDSESAEDFEVHIPGQINEVVVEGNQRQVLGTPEVAAAPPVDGEQLLSPPSSP